MIKSNKSICILSSDHHPLDERIFYHFAKTLRNSGYSVSIVCSTENLKENIEDIVIDSFDSASLNLKEKISAFLSRISIYKPDIIISQEPLTNFVACNYKIRYSRKLSVIYDITEWHPSNTRLSKIPNHLKRLFVGIKEFAKNLASASLVDSFIFGEPAKSFPYKFLFPFKHSQVISYYPSSEYFTSFSEKSNFNEWTLGYSGPLNEEKGIFNFLAAVIELRRRNLHIKIRLLLIGWFPDQKSEQNFYNKINHVPDVETTLISKLPFKEFCIAIGEMDLCFDLRSTNFENNNGLPIKLFYYIANSKPVIYSNLKAIRNNIKEIKEFGALVDPVNVQEVVGSIEMYVNDPDYYIKQSKNARKYHLNKYNWKMISPKLVSLLQAMK